jgi:hypothetical protein
MTIEIHRPELEALLMERMRAGAFQNFEDAILHALETAPAPEARPAPDKRRTGADLIAAIQRSPHREHEIEAERYRMPVRDVAL